MPPPKKVQHKKNLNVIELTWRNGDVSEIAGDKLRQYCACSKCRAKNVVGLQLIGDSGQIDSLKLMGTTGIQIVFADGHDRGVFPWDYLKEFVNGDPLRFLNQ